MWGAHEVDGRISAKNAVKIRAALRLSIDAKEVYENYLATSPAVSDNATQDRARARAWAFLNLRLNNEALRAAIYRLYAEAWVTGEAAAGEAIYEEEELAKAGEIGSIDWSKWQPGDKATAMLLSPPRAFQELVERSGSLIRGLDRTGYEVIGTALADSIRAGYSPKRAAKLIQDAVGSPARALTIAVTESSRVMNSAALARYKDAGITSVKWMAVLSVGGGSVACEKCAENDGQIVQLGQSFNTGVTQPPQHPHCRCNLRPVVPDYADMPNEHGVIDVAPKPPEIMHAGISENELLEYTRIMRAEFEAGVPEDGSNPLRVAYRIKGYNGLPTVLSPEEFAVAAKKADVKVFRGIADREIKASVYKEQYMTGEHFPGLGIFGNGTYSSTLRTTATKFKNSTRDKRGVIMEMLIPDKSKFISLEDLDPIAAELRASLKTRINELDLMARRLDVDDITGFKAIDVQMTEIGQIESAMSDAGVIATMLGYDGLIISSNTISAVVEQYYVILNRAKVIIKGA